MEAAMDIPEPEVAAVDVESEKKSAKKNSKKKSSKKK